MGAGPSSSGGGGSNRYEPPKKKNPVVEFVKGGGFVGAAVRGIKKSAAKSKAKKEANVEMGLGTDRMSNYSTGQGGTKPDGGEGAGAEGRNNTITQVTQTAPTEAEVSQSTTTEAEPDTEANRLLKIKKKGRSQSIISGSRGVTKTSTDYSLGKKSLLGRV